MSMKDAYMIFANIDSLDYTDEQKGAAILAITKMATFNSIKKSAMLKVIRYLLDLAFEVPEEDDCKC